MKSLKFLSILFLIFGLTLFIANAQDMEGGDTAVEAAIEESATEEVEENSEGISADILINLTTDDTWAAGMALGLAGRMIEQGSDVAIFLNVEGVRIASTVISHDTHSMAEKTPHEMLADLIENGATVIVCPVCQEKAGIADEDLLEGTIKGKPDLTIPLILNPDVKLLSY